MAWAHPGMKKSSTIAKPPIDSFGRGPSSHPWSISRDRRRDARWPAARSAASGRGAAKPTYEKSNLVVEQGISSEVLLYFLDADRGYRDPRQVAESLVRRAFRDVRFRQASKRVGKPDLPFRIAPCARSARMKIGHRPARHPFQLSRREFQLRAPLRHMLGGCCGEPIPIIVSPWSGQSLPSAQSSGSRLSGEHQVVSAENRTYRA